MLMPLCNSWRNGRKSLCKVSSLTNNFFFLISPFGIKNQITTRFIFIPKDAMEPSPFLQKWKKSKWMLKYFHERLLKIRKKNINISICGYWQQYETWFVILWLLKTKQMLRHLKKVKQESLFLLFLTEHLFGLPFSACCSEARAAAAFACFLASLALTSAASSSSSCPMVAPARSLCSAENTIEQ